jgi:hypothetical protein
MRAERATGPDLGQDDAVGPDLGRAGAAESDPGRAGRALDPGCWAGADLGAGMSWPGMGAGLKMWAAWVLAQSRDNQPSATWCRSMSLEPLGRGSGGEGGATTRNKVVDGVGCRAEGR